MLVKQMRGGDAAALRKRLKMRQREFWNRVGVTQSSGSRYEGENRVIPITTRMLITLAYSRDPTPFFNRLPIVQIRGDSP